MRELHRVRNVVIALMILAFVLLIIVSGLSDQIIHWFRH